MQTVLLNDSVRVLQESANIPKFQIIPLGSINVQKVGSMDELKAKFANSQSMRPAVLVNKLLLVKGKENPQ